MRSDLVAVIIHLLDNTSPVLIDGALSKVVTGDEESGMGSSRLKQLHHTLSVNVRAIIVSDSDRTGIVADVDALTTVGNASKLGTKIIASACTSRGLVSTKVRV